jgi:hypothetical protein
MNPAEYVDFDKSSNTLHIKKGGGVRFTVGGKVAAPGDHKLTKNTTVRAYERGRLFDEGVKTEWRFEVSDDSSNKSDDLGEATKSEDSDPNEVEDTPTEPTAGSTPESPRQGNRPVPPAGISGLNRP